MLAAGETNRARHRAIRTDGPATRDTADARVHSMDRTHHRTAIVDRGHLAPNRCDLIVRSRQHARLRCLHALTGSAISEPRQQPVQRCRRDGSDQHRKDRDAEPGLSGVETHEESDGEPGTKRENQEQQDEDARWERRRARRPARGQPPYKTNRSLRVLPAREAHRARHSARGTDGAPARDTADPRVDVVKGTHHRAAVVDCGHFAPNR